MFFFFFFLFLVKIYEDDYFTKNRYVILPDDNGKLHFVDLQEPVTRLATLYDITLYLHRSNNESPEVIEASSYEKAFTSTKFDPKLKTVFIIHGWNNDYTSPVNTFVREAVLDNYNVNLFVVDWGTPAHDLNYVTAKASALFVGNFIGDVLNHMIDNLNYSPTDIYLIGHSLGAHSCGVAGTKTGSKIHLIVGLDAAKPLFSPDKPEERLDPTDAQFVHVVHTNTAFLGYKEPLGHADYYPNGGKKQAGCGLDLLGICSHGRSYEYFAESIKLSKFISYKCESYYNFEGGLCTAADESLLGQLEVDRK